MWDIVGVAQLHDPEVGLFSYGAEERLAKRNRRPAHVDHHLSNSDGPGLGECFLDDLFCSKDGRTLRLLKATFACGDCRLRFIVQCRNSHVRVIPRIANVQNSCELTALLGGCGAWGLRSRVKQIASASSSSLATEDIICPGLLKSSCRATEKSSVQAKMERLLQRSCHKVLQPIYDGGQQLKACKFGCTVAEASRPHLFRHGAV